MPTYTASFSTQNFYATSSFSISAQNEDKALKSALDYLRENPITEWSLLGILLSGVPFSVDYGSIVPARLSSSNYVFSVRSKPNPFLSTYTFDAEDDAEASEILNDHVPSWTFSGTQIGPISGISFSKWLSPTNVKVNTGLSVILSPGLSVGQSGYVLGNVLATSFVDPSPESLPTVESGYVNVTINGNVSNAKVYTGSYYVDYIPVKAGLNRINIQYLGSSQSGYQLLASSLNTSVVIPKGNAVFTNVYLPQKLVSGVMTNYFIRGRPSSVSIELVTYLNPPPIINVVAYLNNSKIGEISCTSDSLSVGTVNIPSGIVPGVSTMKFSVENDDWEATDYETSVLID